MSTITNPNTRGRTNLDTFHWESQLREPI